MVPHSHEVPVQDAITTFDQLHLAVGCNNIILQRNISSPPASKHPPQYAQLNSFEVDQLVIGQSPAARTPEKGTMQCIHMQCTHIYTHTASSSGHSSDWAAPFARWQTSVKFCKTDETKRTLKNVFGKLCCPLAAPSPGVGEASHPRRGVIRMIIEHHQEVAAKSCMRLEHHQASSTKIQMRLEPHQQSQTKEPRRDGRHTTHHKQNSPDEIGAAPAITSKKQYDIGSAPETRSIKSP